MTTCTFMVVHVNKFMWQSLNIYSFDSIKYISIKYRHFGANRQAATLEWIEEKSTIASHSIRWNTHVCIPNERMDWMRLSGMLLEIVYWYRHDTEHATFVHCNCKYSWTKREKTPVQWIIGLIFMAFNLHSIAFLFPQLAGAQHGKQTNK